MNHDREVCILCRVMIWNRDLDLAEDVVRDKDDDSRLSVALFVSRGHDLNLDLGSIHPLSRYDLGP